MSTDLYLSFIAYACAATFTPGPNNILLLASSGRFGLKKCLPLMYGIWTGLICVMLLAGSFCDILGHFMPRIVPVFKYVGFAYILYLACVTFRRKPVSTDRGVEDKPLKFWNGFLLQFLNVKVIMLGLASYPGYFFPQGGGPGMVVLFAVTMTLICGTGNMIWAVLGSLICPVYNRYYKAINVVMALLLVYCAVKMLL